MEDFILELPFPEDENIFGNLFSNYILLYGWDNNWDEEIALEPNSHGFYGVFWLWVHHISRRA